MTVRYRGERGQVELQTRDNQRAGDNQHVVDQRDYRAGAEAPTHAAELQRDIDAHENRRERDRQKAVDAKIAADLAPTVSTLSTSALLL